MAEQTRLETSALSQAVPTTTAKEFDTGIPFIHGTVRIPYGVLPQLYVIFTLVSEFLFELPFCGKIIIDYFWIWFYLRFFMRTMQPGAADPKTGEPVYEIGDLSAEFGLHSFFPERLQPPILAVSDLCYALLNMCGFVNGVRRWLAGSSSPAESQVSLSALLKWLPSFKRAE